MVNKLVMNNCSESLKKMHTSGHNYVNVQKLWEIFQLESVCPKTGGVSVTNSLYF